MEWKVGDRFTLEFKVTGWSGELLECKTMSSARRAFPPSDMQYAKLIHPATPEPQKLDTSKPMRISSELMEVRYLTTHPNGLIAAQTPDGLIKWYAPHDLENIPEPKRTTTQIVELVKFDFGPRIMPKSDGAFYVNVTSRAKVTYTEGEGWSIEEAEA